MSYNELLTRVSQFGKGGGRTALLEALTTELASLFRQKDEVVRANAAIFLGRLNSQSAPLAGGGKAVRYWPSYRPLIGALEDPNQTTAVKAAAARGLQDILAMSDIPRRERDDIIIRLGKLIRQNADPANWPQNPVQRGWLLAACQSTRQRDGRSR